MTNFQKYAGQCLENVCLVNDGYLFAPILECVVKCELYDLARPLASVDARRNGHRVGIVADRNVVLEGNIKASEIFSHKYDVDVVVPPARHHASDGTDVGIETELFAQTNIDRPKTSQWAL